MHHAVLSGTVMRAALCAAALAYAAAGSPLESATHALCFSECRLSDRVGHMNATLMLNARCENGEGLELSDGYSRSSYGFASLDAVELGGTMTMALWLKPAAAPTVEGKPSRWAKTILGLYSGEVGAYTDRIDMWTSSAGTLGVSYDETTASAQNTTTETVQVSGEVLAPGEWSHVAWTVDDTQLVLYQDGALVASADVHLSPRFTTRDTHSLGDSVSRGMFSVHGIFSLHIWLGRALDQSEIMMMSAFDDDASACRPTVDDRPENSTSKPSAAPANQSSTVTAYSWSSSDRAISFSVTDAVVLLLLCVVCGILVWCRVPRT